MRTPAPTVATHEAASPVASQPRGGSRQPAKAGTATSVEAATRLGHHFGRVAVSSGQPPIQAAGLWKAYSGVKGGLGKVGGAVSSGYGKVTGAIKATRPYKAVANLAQSAKDRKDDLMDRVRSSGLYGDVQKISKDSGFHKLRAVMGFLGLAGGTHGAKSRQAFGDRWENYFAGLSPKKRAEARLKYSMPDPQSPEEQLRKQHELELDQAEEAWQRRKRIERARRRQGRARPDSGSESEGIEMQPLVARQPPNRFGDANNPFEVND